MENLLIILVEDCNQKRIPIGTIGTDEKEEITSEGEGCVSKEILIKELEQMFRNLETVKQQITGLDPNVERSMLVRLENVISCYHEMYEEKKKATSVETTVVRYFSRKLAYPFFTRFAAHFFNKRFLACLLFIILYTSIYVHS
jgi:hypothetical protein